MLFSYVTCVAFITNNILMEEPQNTQATKAKANEAKQHI